MIIIEKPIMFEALFVINVRAGAVIDMLVGVEEIIVVAAVVTALEFAVPISYGLYFVDVLSDMVVDALIDVLAVMIIGFVSDIGNVFASLITTLEFPVPPPLREFGCSDAFGC